MESVLLFSISKMDLFLYCYLNIDLVALFQIYKMMLGTEQSLAKVFFPVDSVNKLAFIATVYINICEMFCCQLTDLFWPLPCIFLTITEYEKN